MTVKFNADEIFEMAEKIEKNGADFYLKAAEMFSGDAAVSQLMKDLAGMEEEHRIVYAAMRAQVAANVAEDNLNDPDNLKTAYLNAIADKNVFDVNKGPSSKLTGNESLKEVLHIAIGAEKDSIIFYLGLQDIVPANLGQDKIQNIIAEEKKHIVLLTKHLRAAS